MAYDIHYGGSIIRREQKKEHKTNNMKPHKKAFVIIVIMIALIFVLQIPAVQDFLIPGNKAVTKAAYYEMMDNLKSGYGFQKSVEAFCREIIDNGQIY